MDTSRGQRMDQRSDSVPALSVQHVVKHFGGVQALRGVSLSVRHGEILGLVGHNGAGKSTLIRIITGDLVPDSGEITVDGQPVSVGTTRQTTALGIGVVRQELNLVPELTLAENIFLGDEREFTQVGFLDRRAMAEKARPLLARVGLLTNPNARLGSLTIGDQQLVAAARALRSAARILLLDEPTSSLSPWEAERLFVQIRALAQQGAAIIYISHRIDEVANLCHRVIVLRDGQAVAEYANPAQSKALMIESMAPGAATLARTQNDTRGAALFDINEVVIGKHGPCSCTLYAGEIVGLFGLVGAGRTTIARGLVGDLPLDAGALRLRDQTVKIRSPWHGYRLGIAYLSEKRTSESIFVGMSVGNNITVRPPPMTSSAGWLRSRRTHQIAAQTIADLTIKAPHLTMRIEALSGGNQQKAVLGRLLADHLDVLILDEPTHGIDVAAKHDLHALLAQFVSRGKAVLYISSEMSELLTVADRLLVMREGRIVRELDPRQTQEREILAIAAGAEEAKERESYDNTR